MLQRWRLIFLLRALVLCFEFLPGHSPLTRILFFLTFVTLVPLTTFSSPPAIILLPIVSVVLIIVTLIFIIVIFVTITLCEIDLMVLLRGVIWHLLSLVLFRTRIKVTRVPISISLSTLVKLTILLPFLPHYPRKLLSRSHRYAHIFEILPIYAIDIIIMDIV